MNSNYKVWKDLSEQDILDEKYYIVRKISSTIIKPINEKNQFGLYNYKILLSNYKSPHLSSNIFDPIVDGSILFNPYHDELLEFDNIDQVNDYFQR